jgi:WD40 repeat protein
MGRIFRLALILLALPVLFSCSAEEKKEKDLLEQMDKQSSGFGASGAAYSPNGQLLAIANREKVWIINTRTGNAVNSIRSSRYGKFGNAKGLLFIDDERLLIGISGGIVLFNLADDRLNQKYRFSNDAYPPRAMAWSAETQTLAFSSASMMPTVNLLQISGTGFGPARKFPGFDGVPADLLFSDDGIFLAGAGDGSGVQIREVAGGELAGELPTSGYVNELARFGENRLLVAGADLEFWAFYSDSDFAALENPDLQGQINSQKAVKVAGVAGLSVLFFLGLAAAVVSGGGGGEVLQIPQLAYDLANSPVQTSSSEWCGRSTTISPDGSLLADVYPGITKEVISVLAVKSGKVLMRIDPPGNYSCNVKFHPNGQQLLVTTHKVVRIYDTGTWKYYDLKLY